MVATPQGLFEGVVFHGVRGDPALFYDAEDEVDNPDRPLPIVDSTDPEQQNALNALRRSLPLRTVLAERWRLPLMLQAPRRSKVDESAYFSDGADLSDNTVALMRQLEGRIKLYRDAISISQSLLDSLRKQAVALDQRIQAVGEDLAEARHDVAVTRALIAEEEARLDAINDRRAQILRDHVRFIAYQRPREAELITPAPMRQLDPGCSRRPFGLPQGPSGCTRRTRRAARGGARGPVALVRLGAGVARQAGPRRPAGEDHADGPAAQPDHEPPGDGPARRGGGQGRGRGDRRAAGQAARRGPATAGDEQPHRPVLIGKLGWQGARAEAEKIVSLGDLIDGEHGSGFVASQAAAAFENISRIAACLHEAFSGVLPSVRLDWAERLSQFDATPRLRNLAGLPRWGELDYETRRELQAYADWLFGQMKAGDSEAEGLINDVVHVPAAGQPCAGQSHHLRSPAGAGHRGAWHPPADPCRRRPQAQGRHAGAGLPGRPGGGAGAGR